MKRDSADIEEVKREKLEEQHGTCPICRLPLNGGGELANRIPQRRWCIKRFGADVIHHPMNMMLTHSQCNSGAQINPESLWAQSLAATIKSEMRRNA